MIVPLAFAFTSLVEGETCPAPDVVRERVRAILQLPSERALGEAFLVERREAGLFVELRAEDAAVIGQRLLPKEGSCDELAQAAAVVLSAWLSDVHPDFAGGLPTTPAAPPSEPATEAPAPLAPAPAPAPPPNPREPPVVPRALDPRYRWEGALGVGVDFSWPKVAIAGTLRAAYLPTSSGLGLSLSALADASRREPLGSGSVSWRRWPLALSPTLRFVAASWLVDASFGPALAWLHFEGQGFEPNKRPNGVTWAAFADLRVASRGPRGVWAGLSGLAYLADTTARVGSERYPLPRFTLAACVGARLAP